MLFASSSIRSAFTRATICAPVFAALVACLLFVGCDDPDTGTGETSGSGGKAAGGTGGKSGAGGGAAGKSGAGGTGGAGKSGSGGSGGAAGMCPSPSGGAVTAPTTPEKQCVDSAGAAIKQETNESACTPAADASVPDDDAGVEEEAPILYGSEGDDDDCKYHLKWTATCITQKRDVTFNVSISRKSDGKPLTTTGADPIPLDVYLDETHLAPDTKTKSKQTAPGEFTIGPVQFDAKGKWTVRFHMRAECVDLTEDSPHGHAAFFVDVP